MLTIGAGVGGGILLDGRLFEGGRMGGSELGHTVIVENGKPCSCGRRGCLEAYVSLTALKEEAAEKYGRAVSIEELFSLYEKKEETATELMKEYINKLGTGIVNIVNIFRPQVVLIGGDLASRGEPLLEALRERVQRKCFGWKYREIPEIELAALGKDTGMIGAASLL